MKIRASERQMIALRWPCARGVQTLSPCFRELDRGWSSILTVNK